MALLDGIDVTEPCLIWPELQKAYYRLLKGDREVRVKFANQQGHTEEVEFSDVSPKDLMVEIEKLKAACARKSGRRTRFAVAGRFRPRPY